MEPFENISTEELSVEDQIAIWISNHLERTLKNKTIHTFTPSIVNGRRYIGLEWKGTSIMIQIDNANKQEGNVHETDVS